MGPPFLSGMTAIVRATWSKRPQAQARCAARLRLLPTAAAGQRAEVRAKAGPWITAAAGIMDHLQRLGAVILMFASQCRLMQRLLPRLLPRFQRGALHEGQWRPCRGVSWRASQEWRDQGERHQKARSYFAHDAILSQYE